MNIWKIRIETFFHYTDLVKELVSRDLKLKYRRSILGYLWSILNPLLIMIIMTMVFSRMFDRNIENYAVYLLIGRTLFEFVNTATTQGMLTVRSNHSLIKKVYIPKYVFPLAKVTSCMVDCVFSLGALLIVMIVTKTPFSPCLLFFPIVIVQAYVFACGFALFLAQGVVFFRDLQYIYKAFSTAWMYLTPIFYPVEQLPDKLQWLVIHLNPLYSYVTQFRIIVLDRTMPEMWMVVSGFVWAFAMLVFGIITFKRSQDKFILYI